MNLFSIPLPRTKEGPVRERGDECSELPARAAPQSHGRKSVVRGLLLPVLLFVFGAMVGRFLNAGVARLPFRRRPGESSIPFGQCPPDRLDRPDECGVRK